jgi:hypothetical protein
MPESIDKNTSRHPVICNIQFAFTEDVASCFTHTDGYSKIVSFASGKGWNELYFTKGTAKFFEKEKEEEAGSLVDQSLKFSFPGTGAQVESLFSRLLSNRSLIIRIQFDTGKSKVFGSKDCPAMFRKQSETSSKSVSAECEFYCTGEEFAWYLIA